ncbi:MAG: M14 family zinc carboxypeptidase [Saprospiraceae bacterium]
MLVSKYLNHLLLTILLLVFNVPSFAQDLEYYLPDAQFKKGIQSPEEFLGYQIGEWHISHDQLWMYVKYLAEQSDRLIYKEIGRTHEARPLVNLTISSPDNLQNLESIRKAHLENLNPEKKDKNFDLPVVVYQGFSIHGNEPSGGNAAALLAYYLAAGDDDFVEEILKNCIIILDPCFNPDGFNRFASWVNSHKNKNLSSDVQSLEFNEPWPGGRTNHYWFDLNRDWLPAVHPESKARLKVFYDWMPNILTDHHEMGSNKTFFFQPGVPSRTNPLTPLKNQELTGKIGKYHAKALNEIGSLYYSEEGYDDFYYGKGSTFPDAVGSIGILFEQASSRGHARDTEFGTLTFPFTIKNQLTAAKSTLSAAIEMKQELQEYQSEFYELAGKAAKQDKRKAFVVSSGSDSYKLEKFLDVLDRHQVKTYRLKKDFEGFKSRESIIIPLDQMQYTLIRAGFDTLTSFTDSIFYDISAWTLPYAYNLKWKPLESSIAGLIGEQLYPASWKSSSPDFSASKLGYLISWTDYQAPAAAYRLMEKGLKIRVATKAFDFNGVQKEAGTLFLHNATQSYSDNEIFSILKNVAKEYTIHIDPISTFDNENGIDLGSPGFERLSFPRPLLIAGDGASAYETGEAWHFLDQELNIPLPIINSQDLGEKNLSKYTTIILADGSFSQMGTGGTKALKDWITSGGNLLVMGRSVQWAKANHLVTLEIENASKEDVGPKTYENYAYNKARNRINGAIFEAEFDSTHPLAFGLEGNKIPLFRKESFFVNPTNKTYATPFQYTENALLAGYISKENKPLINNSAAVTVHAYGRGSIICSPDSWNFRGFWIGTNRLFVNSLFLHGIINRGTME